MRFNYDPDAIVFWDLPAKDVAAFGMKSNGFARIDDVLGSCFLRPPPSCLTRFATETKLTLYFPGARLLFVGSRKTPSGKERLVIIGWPAYGRASDFFVQPFNAWVVVPASLSASARLDATGDCPANATDRGLRDDETLEYFGGQKDRTDVTHVIIRYKVNNDEGIIDAWLQDDDSIRLRFRDGPGAQSHE
jgi:hypothetical protein